MVRSSLITLCLLAAVAVPVRAGDAEKNREELERIRQEMEARQEQIRHASRKETSVLSSLEKIDRAIQAGSDELKASERKIAELEASLAEIDERSRIITEELPRLQAAYGRRLRSLYKMSRGGSYTLAILSADSFTSAYRRIRYLGTIAEHDQQLIEQYSAALEHLAYREQEVSELQRELLADRKALTKKRAALKTRRREKTSILLSLKQEKSVNEATLKDLEESSANLWAMIRLAEEGKKAPERPAAEAAGRRLPWPLNGRVLTTFGMQRHPEFGTMVFRRGIEIAAREGDEVRAVEGGQVAWADWYRGYGRLVIIEHAGTLYSLYGHLSGLDVKRGDRVEQGQVIGRAGDTGSLKGTKLYFELRRNGEAEDPLTWLSASRAR